MSKGQFKIRKISNQGTSNPIIARMHVGLFEIIKWASISEEDKDLLKETVFDLGLCLVKVESIGKRLQNNITIVIEKIQKEGIKTQSSDRCIDLPFTEDLDDVRDFLKHSKRILQKMLKVFNFFLNTEYTLPHYDKIHKKLVEKYGQEDEISKVLKEDHDLWIKEIIDLRNEDEHPKKWSVLYNDFDIIWSEEKKKWIVISPTFSNGRGIYEFIDGSLYNLLTFCEENVVNFVRKSMPKMINVFQIPEEARDFKCPKRFRVSSK